MNMDQLAKKAAGRADFFFRKHGPAILTTAGIGGFIATTYLTGRAVLKSQEKIAKLRVDHQEINTRAGAGDITTKEQARLLGELYSRDGMKILKDFSPAIATGTISIICIISSHKMMQDKQTALVAAYAALDQGFRAYRKRIEEELGPEKELELYRGVRLIEKEGEGDSEVPSCEIDYGENLPSPYAKFFDEYNVNWSKTPEYNLMFLRSQQDWANDRLLSHGFVFLNEVYESLGLPRTQYGQIVGWKRKEAGGKDGFVDFGIYDIFDESSRAFVNGTEHTILLDFNVDGPITI